jgi:hypothetical protein
MGQQFDPDTLKALTVDMGPNTSAILVVIEDKAAEAVADELGQYGAKVVTLTLGSQLSGELASFGAVSLADVAEEGAEPDTEQDADERIILQSHEPVETIGPGEPYDPTQAQTDVVNRNMPHI